jgi:hypothetical protein
LILSLQHFHTMLFLTINMRKPNITGSIIYILLIQLFSIQLIAGGASSSPTLEQQFVLPPREAKPYIWWMWLGAVNPKECITRDLEEFKSKGLIGVTIKSSSLGPVWYPGHKVVLNGKEYRKVETNEYGGKSAEKPKGNIEFWSNENLDAISFAAKEANRIGLDLGLQISTNAPREFVSNEYAQQIIDWSTSTYTGPGLFTGTLPVPDSKIKDSDKKLYGTPYHRDIITLAFPDKSPLKAEEIVNISNKMDMNGRVSWNVPEGKWIIMRFVQVSTQFGNESSVHLDGLSTEAMDKGWAATVGRLLTRMTTDERKGLKLIEEDSWEAGHPTWTKVFPDEFKKRRGYDLLSYLPALTGRIIENRQLSDQIKRDHQKTIDDLIADNHYAYRKKLANKEGLLFYSEAGGPNMKDGDLLKNFGSVDVAMAEFWMPSPHRSSFERRFLLREAASANHIYGKKYTVCESFTSVGPHWEETPFMMKATADQAFCDGLNRVAFHTASLSPSMTARPGYTMWAGTHYEPGMTWWNQSPAFNTYIARCSYLLQQGLFAADVLFYQGEKSGYSHVLKKVFPTLGEGYDYDHCNTDVLLTRLNVKNGRIVLPDGMSYSILVLPNNMPMQLSALEKVASLIKAGATVVGSAPSGIFNKPLNPGDKEKFETLVKNLWGDAIAIKAIENRIGKGRLVWGKTARQVLEDLGIEPDFRYQGLSDAGTIDWIHRTMSDGTEIYFIASRWETPESVKCSFRVTGKQPELWNSVTGEIRNATAFRQENSRTIVPLEFDPCGSVFIIFRNPIGNNISGSTAGNYPQYKPFCKIDGSWDVSFDPKWGVPAKVKFVELTDWTKHAEDGIKFYSGTAIYKKDFKIDTLPEKSRQLILDLGEVREVAEVRLNGQNLGVVWTKPALINITNAVKAGVNKLEVSIVNLWPNRLIGDASLPKELCFTETNMRKFTSNSPLLPSGLLGPVQILVEDTMR